MGQRPAAPGLWVAVLLRHRFIQMGVVGNHLSIQNFWIAWHMQVPSLLDGWNEARDKFIVDKDNFKTQALEKFQTKSEEFELWHKTVDGACANADSIARTKLEAFEKAKKHAVRDIRLDPQIASTKVSVMLVCIQKCTYVASGAWI